MLSIDIEKDLEGRVSLKRYKHVLGVVETAEKLAEHYGVSKEKAKLAALLHDIMKEEKLEVLNHLCSKKKFKEIRKYEKSNEVLHGFAGAEYAEEKYGIKDEEILNAVRYHTVGRKNMEILEKIIYIADGIEPGREYENVDKIRELAFKDLDEAILFEVNKKIIYLIETDKIIHINALKMRNDLLKKR
ncbi:MAG: bis(5'-nucleosyl)-tetraphosphatase (symmetrical) YqeK [Fusobacteriaceae bacterium]